MEGGNLMEEEGRLPRPQRRRFAPLWFLNELLGSFLNLRSFHLVILGGIATFAGMGGFILALVEGRGFVNALITLAVCIVGASVLSACILEHSKK